MIPQRHILRIEQALSTGARGMLVKIFLFVGIAGVGFFVAANILPVNIPYINVAGGMGLIAFSFFFFFGFLEFYYRTALTGEMVSIGSGRIKVSSEILRLWALMPRGPDDKLSFREWWRALADTDAFHLLLFRLGIARGDFDAWFKIYQTSNAPQATIEAIVGESHALSVARVLVFAIDADTSFAEFLFAHEVKREDLEGAALWVEAEFEEEYARTRWWSRARLARIPGIGKDLGYGYTWTLNQYSHDLSYGTTHFAREARKDEIERVEEVLARNAQANVLLVGEEGSGKHAVLEGLAEWIRTGHAHPALEHKRVVFFDSSSVVAGAQTKGAFESLMIQMFNEAVGAGNILLVIENFPSFIASAHELGVDVVTLLEPYMAGSAIQIVALSDTDSFHRDLESNGKIMKLFEKVTLEEPTRERTLGMLQDALGVIEPHTRKFFTYPALLRAYELADRFITTGAMPEKAIDLLQQAASAVPTDRIVIMPSDIDTVVEKKTHIPTTIAEPEERSKLLHLEELIGARVIGQARAVHAVSDALRRARSGLRASTRPVGSFLFLGPTGVGKTETAKALAFTYFGGEESMFRFDMSEYQGVDGIEKLIGSRDAHDPGILVSRLREKPFSLLLFDEFEKASHEVHNLFLQILDEGLFSDGAGKKVSARETMIIATSNAGANIIWDLLKEGKELADIEGRVIDAIRRERIFSPELLNRFDATIVYRPLDKSELTQVAMLLLQDLMKRLQKQEIIFEPTPELAARVVEIGYDPTFGARPMRRAIADRVEQVIAKKILEGKLKRGDTFRFSAEDIAGL
ncbi:MAG: ATP-dependent Clp protease ATP-binding subunit [Candidatus Ryanbacteria bacterium]|nr:ATP-dependent Clp protease ATP-binding subunit [Candidatus Ryanbacteria bacterium]